MKQIDNDLYCLLDSCDKENECCIDCEYSISFVDFAEIQTRFIEK